MAGRMGNKFVTLCSVAVGAVYVTGYVLTDSGHSALASNGSMPLSGQSATKTSTSGTHHSSGATSTSAKTGAGSKAKSNTQSGSSSSTGGGATGGGSATSGSQTGQSPGVGSGHGSSGTSTKTASSTAQQKYLDGTYNGTGTNQIGSVSVALTISGGKIANVQITQCDTHYPEAYIDPILPQEVLQRQSYQVTIVSGATLSTYDFAYAVYQCLNQAKNPNYKA